MPCYTIELNVLPCRPCARLLHLRFGVVVGRGRWTVAKYSAHLFPQPFCSTEKAGVAQDVTGALLCSDFCFLMLPCRIIFSITLGVEGRRDKIRTSGEFLAGPLYLRSLADPLMGSTASLGGGGATRVAPGPQRACIFFSRAWRACQTRIVIGRAPIS